MVTSRLSQLLKFEIAVLTFFIDLAVFAFNVFILYRIPSFDKKAMRVVIGTLYIPQIAFGNKVTCHNRRSSNYFLDCTTPEIERILIDVDPNAVDLNFLTDISRDNVGIVTVLPQIIVL